jgi:L-threonylcarbamoyladenylate synthase
MKILKVDKKNLRKVVRITEKSIKKGEVVLCPTDTVYGIVCDATNKKTISDLFKIKDRPSGKPVPVFIKDLKMAKKFSFISKDQEKFLKKFWPGKITAVLNRKNVLPRILFGKTKTIGLRIPNYKLINDLLLKLNRPLTGTSANISGKPASTKIKEIISQFKKRKKQPDLILDFGDLKPSLPSTVIDLTRKKIKILRK